MDEFWQIVIHVLTSMNKASCLSIPSEVPCVPLQAVPLPSQPQATSDLLWVSLDDFALTAWSPKILYLVSFGQVRILETHPHGFVCECSFLELLNSIQCTQCSFKIQSPADILLASVRRTPVPGVVHLMDNFASST